MLVALSSSEQLDKGDFARLPTALPAAAPYNSGVFHQAERELTPLSVLRYGFVHRKRWFENPIPLNTTRSLSEASFRRGMAILGEQVLVELVSAIGFYSMVAMTLNAFAVSVPGGSEPLV